jgi:PPOX class probable F420-dependent enzyme
VGLRLDVVARLGSDPRNQEIAQSLLDDSAKNRSFDHDRLLLACVQHTVGAVMISFDFLIPPGRPQISRLPASVVMEEFRDAAAAEHRMRYHRIDRDRGFESRRPACRRLVERRFPGWRSRTKPCSIGAIDSHRAAERHLLSDHELRFLLTRPVGHLATADSRAIPHVVPVCFAISKGSLYITIDEKPKRVAGPALKRIRNIERNPMVTIVVDRYDDDWTRLGWVMLRGRAEILRAGTEHDRAQVLLRARYRQLAAMQIADQPVIAVRLERVTSWGNLAVGADEAAKLGKPPLQ